jgi:hypothetical protein
MRMEARMPRAQDALERLTRKEKKAGRLASTGFADKDLSFLF